MGRKTMIDSQLQSLVELIITDPNNQFKGDVTVKTLDNGTVRVRFSLVEDTWLTVYLRTNNGKLQYSDDNEDFLNARSNWDIYNRELRTLQWSTED